MAFRVDGNESWDSQVSKSARISMFWSAMNSLRTVGLSRSTDIEETEQTFRRANSRVVAVGPGLRWISPARARRRENMNQVEAGVDNRK